MLYKDLIKSKEQNNSNFLEKQKSTENPANQITTCSQFSWFALVYKEKIIVIKKK